MQSLRILVVNPLLLRLKALGACEQDRLANAADLVRYGHQVKLLTQQPAYSAPGTHLNYYAERGIDAQVIPVEKARFSPARLRHLAYLDGAAWEYAAPRFTQAVDAAIQTWKPDLVWCHATYLWPPALRARRFHLPTVIRSVNHEAAHLLQEDGHSLPNWMRFVGKWLGERLAARYASVLAAITPDEAAIYGRIAPTTKVRLLPLRTLPAMLRPPRRATRTEKPLRVFMLGASYNVPHNRAALEFVVREVVPTVRQHAPGRFEFHILGGKLPDSMRVLAAPDLCFDGYVEDLAEHLDTMDIALSPSRFGQGMQQKVFEPLCRAFPTITNRRAVAGYPFEDGAQVLFADDAPATLEALIRLEDAELREALSEGASAQAAALFSRDKIDEQVRAVLREAMQHPV